MTWSVSSLYQQHNSCKKCKDRNKLRRRKYSHTSSCQISAEKLQHKSSCTIKNQIRRRCLSIFFLASQNQEQQTIMKKVKNTGINLRRNQRHPIWCKSRRMKRNGKSTGRFFSVTASCQQAPNSSKSLCKRYRRH